MKCFYHSNVDAVGLCKNCSKGICSDCACDVGNGLACKNFCEENVKNLNKVNRRIQSYPQRAIQSYRFAGFLGIILMSLPIAAILLLKQEISSELLSLGSLGLILSFVMFKKSRELKKQL